MYQDTKLESGGAYLLTWNPKKYPRFVLSYYVKHRDELDEWATGNTKYMQSGAPFFFLRQGPDHPGIIGWGQIRSQVRQQKHWDPAKARAKNRSNEVSVSMDFLTMHDDPRAIPRSALRADRKTMDGNWDAEASGTRLTARVAEGVRRMLIERRVKVPQLDALPDVTQRSTPYFLEGAAKQVLTTRHERSKNARKACIAYHGCICKACGFDFGLHYGPEADGMIEVHHLNPISQARESAHVDHIKDLVPLCANCHRVTHLNGRAAVPLPMKELRRMVRKYGAGF